MASAYEKARLKRIAENHAELVRLGLEDSKVANQPPKKKVRRRAAARPRRGEVKPSRRSTRQRGLNVDGKTKVISKDELFAKRNPHYAEFGVFGLVLPKKYMGRSSDVDKKDLIPELPGLKAWLGAPGDGPTKTQGKHALFDKPRKVTKKERQTGSLDALQRDLDGLRIDDEGDVAKVTTERAFALTMHPSPRATVVVVGDKWGEVGLWRHGVTRMNTETAEEEEPLTIKWQLHTRPICGMCWDESSGTAATRLYSVSYDGTMRETDLVAGKSTLRFSISEFDDDAGDDKRRSHEQMLTAIDAVPTRGGILIGTGGGDVVMLDPRKGRGRSAVAWRTSLHEERVSCIHFARDSSSHPDLFATASRDRTVKLWDLRHVADAMSAKGKKKKKKTTTKVTKASSLFLREYVHSGAVNSAYYSGGRVLTTSMDDTIRVYDVDGDAGSGSSSSSGGKMGGSSKKRKSAAMEPKLTPSMKMKHNNQTGRWLTKLRAQWLPGRTDAFVVGSMKQPRRMEVVNAMTGRHMHAMRGEALGSVQSLVCFHPAAAYNDDCFVVAGVNSSGRVHVFHH